MPPLGLSGLGPTSTGYPFSACQLRTSQRFSGTAQHIVESIYFDQPWHFLYFFPLPQGHFSFLPTLPCCRNMVRFSSQSAQVHAGGWLANQLVLAISSRLFLVRIRACPSIIRYWLATLYRFDVGQNTRWIVGVYDGGVHFRQDQYQPGRSRCYNCGVVLLAVFELTNLEPSIV